MHQRIKSVALFSACVLLITLASTPVTAGTRAGLAEQEIRSDSFRYTIGPVPAFVQRHTDIDATTLGKTNTDWEILLIDRQISLLGEQPQEYVRFTLRALDNKGLPQVSQIYTFFNPDYQRLTLHAIRVVRDGKIQDRTRDVRLELLRRERELERNMYGGEVTGHGILPDIRVGDLVDAEYTVTGENPIFAGRYSQRIPLQRSIPLDENRIRLLYPSQRNIRFKVPSFATSQQETHDGIVTQTVTARHLEALSDDQDRPRWADPMPVLEISEYAAWDGVRQWAGELFQVTGQLAPGLKQKIAAWKASDLPAPQLAAEVLRWVQGEIRYFGIELGVNSHQPAHPNLTFERRFGDCKDKSLLLATLLNALDIEAQPALVSMRLHRGVADALPSHAAFDHVIVRATVGGRVHWLDATLPPQSGSIEQIGVHDFGKALVLGASSEGLDDAGYPDGYREEILATDTYDVKSWREPVVLTSEVRLSGLRAERLRWQLSDQGRTDFERAMQADVQRVVPSAQFVEMEIKDDLTTNKLTLLTHYRLPEFFQYETGRFAASASALALFNFLDIPQVPQRSTPFHLSHPVRVRQSLVFNLPENPINKAPPGEIERTRHWEMQATYRTTAKQLAADFVLESQADAVTPEAMQNYIADTLKLRRNAGINFKLPVAELPEQKRAELRRTLSRYNRFGQSKSSALDSEIQSQVDIVQISADIASGKLTDAQLAKAYGARGIAYDNTEQKENALRDLDEAIRLAPEVTRYRIDKAATLAGHGRFAEAVAIFSNLVQADQLHEANASDLLNYGRSLYYLERYREASEQFAEAIRRDRGIGALFAAYWQDLASQRANGQLTSVLETEMDRAQNQDWPYAIGEMLLDRRSPESLLNAAKSDDRGIERDQLCEAYFYIAQKYLLQGDNERAREFFNKAFHLDVKPYAEYMLAGYELNRLGGPLPRGFFDTLGDFYKDYLELK